MPGVAAEITQLRPGKYELGNTGAGWANPSGAPEFPNSVLKESQ